MKYAWIEGSRIRDIAHGHPADLYHPDIAALYDTQVPDNAANGDGWVDGALVKPEPVVPAPPAPPAVVYKKVSPIEFKLLFTAQERVAIKASTDPIVQDFFSIIEDPRLTQVDLGLTSTQQALAYLTGLGLLVEGRAAEILTGEAQ